MSRALFNSLIDDAAVFPPGDALLADAVPRHADHRQSWYASLVGPLLVPADSAAQLSRLVQPSESLDVVVVARRDVEHHVILEALAELASAPSVHVQGLEAGWVPGWQRLAGLGLPALTVELPRGADQQRQAMVEVAAVTDQSPVRAKYRTGPTPAWPWPDEAELAAFICAAVERGVSFKLTGGLHHAIRAAHDGEQQHGLLNVINAVAAAVAGGDVDVVSGELRNRDVRDVVDRVAALDEAEVNAVRDAFASYGCCGVTDPIAELIELGMLKENE